MTSLIPLFFLKFSIASPKLHYWSTSILFFAFFLRSVFISIYGFIQAFWLNLITLWNFFKNNPWFNACFKFLMCITYPVLSCKLATSFSTFSIYLLSGKNGKSLWSSCNFPWVSTSKKKKKFLHNFLHCSVLWNIH